MSPNAPQSLLSPAARATVATAALAIVAAVVTVAGHASEAAVQSAQAAISPAVRSIGLQPVEVVWRRGVGPVAGACAGAQSPT